MIRRGDSRIARQNIAKTNGRFVNRPYNRARIYACKSQFILLTHTKSNCRFPEKKLCAIEKGQKRKCISVLTVKVVIK